MYNRTSKAVSLFLSLGIVTSLAACGSTPPPAEDGGEEGGALPQDSAPRALIAPDSAATLVANQPTPTPLDSLKDDDKDEAGEGYESSDDDEAGEGDESGDDDEAGEGDESGEGYES